MQVDADIHSELRCSENHFDLECSQMRRQRCKRCAHAVQLHQQASDIHTGATTARVLRPPGRWCWEPPGASQHISSFTQRSCRFL
jgi:hypothetical protein